MKAECKSCKFFKMQSNPQTKELAKVCYANPPVMSAINTQQGIGFFATRPQVADDDYCRLHEPDTRVIS